MHISSTNKQIHFNHIYATNWWVRTACLHFLPCLHFLHTINLILGHSIYPFKRIWKNCSAYFWYNFTWEFSGSHLLIWLYIQSTIFWPFIRAIWDVLLLPDPLSFRHSLFDIQTRGATENRKITEWVSVSRFVSKSISMKLSMKID